MDGAASLPSSCFGPVLMDNGLNLLKNLILGKAWTFYE